MKKPVRILLVSTGAVALAAALLVALAFTPSVQTWLVHRLLVRQVDPAIEVGRVAIGFNRAVVQQLKVRQSGLILTVPELVVDLPVLAVLRGRLEIKRVRAEGWTLDLAVSELAPRPKSTQRFRGPLTTTGLAAIELPKIPILEAPPSTAPLVFDGIFKAIRLPMDLSVEEADLEGKIVFPAAADKTGAIAKVHLTGGQLRSGHLGQFAVSIESAITDARVRSVSAHGRLEVGMDSPRTLSRVAIDFAATAEGAELLQPAKLNLKGSAETGLQGESYSLSVASAQGADAKQLLALQAEYPLSGDTLSGSWKVNGGNKDVAPFALGYLLPSFEASGEGGFQIDRTFSELHALGKFDVSADHLGSVRPELRGLEFIRVRSDFDLLHQGDVVRINHLSLAVAGNQPVASVEALQGIEVNLSTGELKVAQPKGDLLRLRLHGLPVAWAQPFFRSVTLSQSEIQGEFVAAARDGGFVVRSETPLRIGNLSISQEGKPLVHALTVALTVSGTYADRAWQADVSDLSVKNQSGDSLLGMSLKLGKLPGAVPLLKATGRYEIALPAVLAQPGLSQWAGLSRGTAKGDFSVSANSIRQLAAKVELTDLHSADERPLPKLSASLRADFHEDGQIDAELPFTLERMDQKSDLRVTATIKANGTKQVLDAQVESQAIYVDDFQLFLAEIQKFADQGKIPSSGADDSAREASHLNHPPAWRNLEGQVRLILKKISYPPDFEMSDLSGTLKISPEVLTLENLAAILVGGSQARVKGVLKFDQAKTEKYDLGGSFELSNFDPVPLFRALDSHHPPTVEGIFDVDGVFHGTAATAGELEGKLTGQYKLSSKGGVFRAFAASDWASKIQRNSSRFDAVVSLLKPGEKLSDHVANVDNIAQSLAEIKFDQLNLELTRDGSRETLIKDFSLIAPEVRVTGEGTIHYRDGVELIRQPLSARLRIGVRGKLGERMMKEGLLKGETDALGYNAVYAPIPIEGSLAQVDTHQLTKVFLDKVLVYESTSVFDSLLPLNRWRFW